MKHNHPAVFVPGLFATLLIAASLVACSGNRTSTPRDPARQDSSAPVQAPFRKPPGSYSDTITIQDQAAVFFQADSLQLDKAKAILAPDLYETEIHNCFYLMRNARIELRGSWPKVHMLETSNVRYLLFIKSDRSKFLVDLDKVNDLCGIFLFDKIKDPELADMMNIDTALGFYFKK